MEMQQRTRKDATSAHGDLRACGSDRAYVSAIEVGERVCVRANEGVRGSGRGCVNEGGGEIGKLLGDEEIGPDMSHFEQRLCSLIRRAFDIRHLVWSSELGHFRYGDWMILRLTMSPRLVCATL